MSCVHHCTWPVDSLRFVNVAFHVVLKCFFSCLVYRNSTLRKTMSFDNSVSEFSQQSVVFAMERFARAVANMDETVMVPCKLMDVPVGSDPELDQRVPRRSRAMIRDMQAADLHSLYSMLNNLKSELIWGPKTENGTSANTVTNGNNGQNLRSTNMVRRPSVNSMASISSGTTYSDSDSESGLDHESTEDSGVEAEREPDGEESVEQMANQFRRHLLGLHQCLEHMADAAHYLTHRYQVEIGSSDWQPSTPLWFFFLFSFRLFLYNVLLIWTKTKRSKCLLLRWFETSVCTFVCPVVLICFWICLAVQCSAMRLHDQLLQQPPSSWFSFLFYSFCSSYADVLSVRLCLSVFFFFLFRYITKQKRQHIPERCRTFPFVGCIVLATARGCGRTSKHLCYPLRSWLPLRLWFDLISFLICHVNFHSAGHLALSAWHSWILCAWDSPLLLHSVGAVWSIKTE